MSLFIYPFECVCVLSAVLQQPNIEIQQRKMNQPTTIFKTFYECSRLKSWKENNLFRLHIILVQSTVYACCVGATNGRFRLLQLFLSRYNIDIEHFRNEMNNWLFYNEYSIQREYEMSRIFGSL